MSLEHENLLSQTPSLYDKQGKTLIQEVGIVVGDTFMHNNQDFTM